MIQKAVSEKLKIFRMEDESYVYDIKDTFLDYRNNLSSELECIVLLNELNIKNLKISFHNVDELSSAGIGFLLSIFHCCNMNDTKLSLVNCSPEVRDLLAKTCVNKVIEIN